MHGEAGWAHADAEGGSGLGMSVVVRVLLRLPLGELRPSDPTRGAGPEHPPRLNDLADKSWPADEREL